jgi:hypothetical protein
MVLTIFPRELIEVILSFVKDDRITPEIAKRVCRRWYVIIRACATPRLRPSIGALIKHKNLIFWTFHSRKPVVCKDCIFKYAIKKGDIEGLENIKAKFPFAFQWKWACAYATNVRNFDSLVWLRNRGWCDWDLNTPNEAAANGDLDILKYALREGCECDIEALFLRAASAGHQNVLKWLILINGKPNCEAEVCLFALVGGYCSLTRWLIEMAKFKPNWNQLHRVAVEMSFLGFLHWMTIRKSQI